MFSGKIRMKKLRRKSNGGSGSRRQCHEDKMDLCYYYRHALRTGWSADVVGKSDSVF